jgi:hypothetical protein
MILEGLQMKNETKNMPTHHRNTAGLAFLHSAG